MTTASSPFYAALSTAQASRSQSASSQSAATPNPSRDATGTDRMYDWAEVRASKLRSLLEECYNKPYIYEKCFIPWVLRDQLGAWATPPLNSGDPDLLDPTRTPDYVMTLIIRQVTNEAFSTNPEHVKNLSENQVAELRRWATTSQTANKSQLYAELLDKRTQEVGIVRQYYQNLATLRREREQRKADEQERERATSVAQQSGTATEPIEMPTAASQARNRKGPFPQLGSRGEGEAEEDDDESIATARAIAAAGSAPRSASERIAFLRAEAQRVKQMRMHVKREEATCVAHMTSLPAACKALLVISILFIVPCVFAQDGFAIVITLPLALLVGVWGYTVSHTALRAASIVPYSVTAVICAFGYLIYSILRSTIYSALPDGGSEDFQTFTLVCIWVMCAFFAGIAQYSTSLAGLYERLSDRAAAPANFLVAHAARRKTTLPTGPTTIAPRKTTIDL